MILRVSTEVLDYLRTLAPDPRRRLASALEQAAAGKWPLEPLEHNLSGFYKVKERSHRVICVVRSNQLLGLFADKRKTVYEVATIALLEDILGRMDKP